MQPIIAYFGFAPGALTPDDIKARVRASERRLLDRMPDTLELLAVMANELAVVRSQASRVNSTPKSTPRRNRAASRERVRTARLEHPDWTWQDVADECALSRRYAMQLWREAQAHAL